MSCCTLLGLALGFAVLWQRSTLAPDTPLALAAPQADVTAIRALVAAGADVNACDSNGYTPLA